MRSVVVVVGVGVGVAPLPLVLDPVPLADDPLVLVPLLLVPDVDDEPVAVLGGSVEVLVDVLVLPALAGLLVGVAVGAGVTVVMLVAAALLPAPALLAGASLPPPPQAASSVTSAATGVSLKAVMTEHFHAVPLAPPVSSSAVGWRFALDLVSRPLVDFQPVSAKPIWDTSTDWPRATEAYQGGASFGRYPFFAPARQTAKSRF